MIVKEGDDAILSCSPKTKESIESKPFSWTKEGPAGQKKVFLYDTSNNDLKGQDKQFKDRVSHFPEGLKHGDASITIKNTKVTDTGKYMCSFPHLQPQRKAEVFLLVGECHHKTSDYSLIKLITHSEHTSAVFAVFGLQIRDTQSSDFNVFIYIHGSNSVNHESLCKCSSG